MNPQRIRENPPRMTETELSASHVGESVETIFLILRNVALTLKDAFFCLCAKFYIVSLRNTCFRLCDLRSSATPDIHLSVGAATSCQHRSTAALP